MWFAIGVFLFKMLDTWLSLVSLLSDSLIQKHPSSEVLQSCFWLVSQKTVYIEAWHDSQLAFSKGCQKVVIFQIFLLCLRN